MRDYSKYVDANEYQDPEIIPVGEFECSGDPTKLKSNLTDEGYTMKLKYATVDNYYRNLHYFYFIPELTMPETDG